MKENVLLLDCTLRDGGFTNDWNFGFGTIKSIISRLDKAGVDTIEIGFIDQRRDYDNNKTILPNTKSFAPILNGIKLSHAKIAAMIDFGTCDLENIEDKSETGIDIIRVIFKKKDIDAALDFCDKIKSKGYLVSVQPVSVTSYTSEEYKTLIDKINKINPYCVAIVDTYGLMHNVEVSEYFSLLNKNLLPNISIGFHSHNNFQMAYANCISLMNSKTKRSFIVDGSLYGMGKGAGNAPTELLAQYMNENFNKHYDISQMLEAIDVDIMKEYAKAPWGYSLKYFIAASMDCHPDFVQALINKKSLSVRSMKEILMMLPEEKKLSFNKDLIEELYLYFQNKVIDDKESYVNLNKEISGKSLVVLAPGNTLTSEKKAIQQYIKDNNATVISINFLQEHYPISYVFMGNPKRYSQFFHKIHGSDKDIKLICTSNVTETSFPINYCFDFSTLKLNKPLINDNPMLMLLRVLSNMDVKDVALAGFDGYTEDSSNNYYEDYLQFLYCNDDVVKRNELIKEELALLGNKLNIKFITSSFYNK